MGSAVSNLCSPGVASLALSLAVDRLASSSAVIWEGTRCQTASGITG